MVLCGEIDKTPQKSSGTIMKKKILSAAPIYAIAKILTGQESVLISSLRLLVFSK